MKFLKSDDLSQEVVAKMASTTINPNPGEADKFFASIYISQWVIVDGDNLTFTILSKRVDWERDLLIGQGIIVNNGEPEVKWF
jgi:hypothetical protein